MSRITKCAHDGCHQSYDIPVDSTPDRIANKDTDVDILDVVGIRIAEPD